ncbi:DUF3307 domain-containing protein [Candidatus Uhrbacteria bacterium]|jgi:hypothetical protein|nr:DUF3307 domain-containing protein [Candidatus Uhrbacteria bacterium]MBT7717634.1 DUF3307 domain-containing protein [Candidatus Uhrbacteria bacterium]
MDFALLVLVKLTVMYLLFVWGDFGLQSAWMAMEKGKSREVLFYHAVTANAPIMLLWLMPSFELSIVPGVSLALSFSMTALALVIRIVSHMVIDALKARYNIIKTIKMDQFCHVAVDLGLILSGLI